MGLANMCLEICEEKQHLYTGCFNIKRARAKGDERDLNEFGKNTRENGTFPTLQPVQLRRDKFVDDPGRDSVFGHWGRGHVENVKDENKTHISAMWCGNANGELLPPMIVYNTKKLYEAWEKVLYSTKYAATKLDWFDSAT